MNNNVLIIADNPGRFLEFKKSVVERFPTRIAPLSDLTKNPAAEKEIALIMVDVNHAVTAIVDPLNTYLCRFRWRPVVVFVTNHHDAIRPLEREVEATVRFISPDVHFTYLQAFIEGALAERAHMIWRTDHETEYPALRRIREISISIFRSLKNDCPLPQREINDCCESLVFTLKKSSTNNWLDAVAQHHSYTHRHLMTVSGLAIAFGLHFGMRDVDLLRLATGGLMHDVGKAKVPLELLDKPGPLNKSEMAQIARHASFGGEILQQSGDFDNEVIDIAQHHHEYLDGSGYPDGLSNDQISDLVRLITVVDIFSSLIDRRAYREAYTAEQAYEALTKMHGRLDMDLVEAFKPIALAS